LKEKEELIFILIKTRLTETIALTRTGTINQIRLAEKFLVYNEPARTWWSKTFCLFGETGLGKSEWCINKINEMLQRVAEPKIDYYPKNDSSKWWEGYDAHEIIVINDFRADMMKFKDCLNFLDKVPFKLEFKGGSREIRAKHIFISSPMVYQKK
jgi:hypothetical protein